MRGEEKKMLTYTTHKNQWRQSFLVHLLYLLRHTTFTHILCIHTDAIATHTNAKRASNMEPHTHTHVRIHGVRYTDTTIAYSCVKFDICRRCRCRLIEMAMEKIYSVAICGVDGERESKKNLNRKTFSFLLRNKNSKTIKRNWMSAAANMRYMIWICSKRTAAQSVAIQIYYCSIHRSMSIFWNVLIENIHMRRKMRSKNKFGF